MTGSLNSLDHDLPRAQERMQRLRPSPALSGPHSAQSGLTEIIYSCKGDFVHHSKSQEAIKEDALCRKYIY